MNRTDTSYGGGEGKVLPENTAEVWHTSTLSFALLPSAVIMLLFGGRLTLITLCISAILAYIVDLVGYFEGSVVTLTALFGAIFSTLIYAARHILGEGIAHFPFVLSLGCATSYIFFAVLLQFSSLSNDSDGFTSTMHALVCSTVPLVCSSIITWYICVQTRELDIGVCFSLCYFAYMVWMQRPQTLRGKIVENFNSNSGNSSTPIPTSTTTTSLDRVPLLSLRLMHLIPIVVSPILYLTLHHHIISVQHFLHTLLDLSVAILFPVLLMTFSADMQVRYNAYQTDPLMRFRNVTDNFSIFVVKTISPVFLLLSVHNHPLLDDIKAFAQLSDQVASALFIAGSLFLWASVTLRDYYHFEQKRISSRGRKPRYNADLDEVPIMTPVAVAVSLTGTVVCWGVFLGLPLYSLPACVCGILLFSEFYERSFDFKNPFHLYGAMVFVLCAGLVGFLASLNFTRRTLMYLSYAFETPLLASWNGDGPAVGFISIQFFCNLVSGLMFLAIMIPPVLVNTNSLTYPAFGGAARLMTSGSDAGSAGLSASADKSSTHEEAHEDEEETEEGAPTELDMDSDSLGYLPALDNGLNLADGGAIGSASSVLITLVSKSTMLLPSVQNTFASMFILLNLIVAFVEVVVREQDWRDFSVDAETIYPASLFLFTALALCASAVHLRMTGICPASLVVYVTLVVQGCKLMHLFGVSSSGLAACMMLILTYSAPFLLYGDGESNRDTSNSNGVTSSEDSKSTGMNPSAMDSNSQLAGLLGVWVPQIPWWSTLLLVVFAGAASLWFKTHDMMYQILLYATNQHSTETEEAAGCLSIYMLFLGALLLVFYRRQVALRSVFLIVAAVAALIAVDALGPFSLVEMPEGSSFPYSITYRSSTSASGSSIPGASSSSHINSAGEIVGEGVTGEMLSLSDHTGFFLLISVVLALSALLQVFPIMRPLPRLLYVIVFSFTCGMALLGWGFPATVGGQSQADMLLADGEVAPHFVTSLESIYCVVCGLFATSAVFHTLSNSDVFVSKAIVGLWSLIPLLTLIFDVVSRKEGEDDTAAHEGYCWVAIVVAAGIGITVRYIDWFVELTSIPSVSLSSSSSAAAQLRHRSTSSSNLVKSKAAVIGTHCAHCVIVYTVLACALSVKLNRDLLIPLSCLSLYCTRKGYTMVYQQLPVTVSVAMYTTVYWTLSALYSLLLKGYGGLAEYEYLEGFSLSVGILRDENVSIWTAPSLWMPALNLALLACPLYVLYMSYQNVSRRHLSQTQTHSQAGNRRAYTSQTQDSLFVFTLLCLLSIVTSQLWSIRLLGLVSLVSGFRCSAGSSSSGSTGSNRSSNRII